MIEKPITIEGVMRYDEEQSNVTAKVEDYRIAAITKGATYTLIEALPYDFVVQNIFYRVKEALDCTLTLGTDVAPSRLMADADWVKTIGKKSVAKSIMIDAGKSLKLVLGPGTTGKIEVHVTDFLLMPSLL